MVRDNYLSIINIIILLKKKLRQILELFSILFMSKNLALNKYNIMFS